MIAGDSAHHAATLREQTPWQYRRFLRFHSVNMTNFLFGLVSNLALLAIVLIVCHLCNRLATTEGQGLALSMVSDAANWPFVPLLT